MVSILIRDCLSILYKIPLTKNSRKVLNQSVHVFHRGQSFWTRSIPEHLLIALKIVAKLSKIIFTLTLKMIKMLFLLGMSRQKFATTFHIRSLTSQWFLPYPEISGRPVGVDE